MADVLDRIGNPEVTTLSQIKANASGDFEIWLNDGKSCAASSDAGSKIVGYLAVPNLDANDRLWKINGARQVIYGRSELTAGDRIKAVKKQYDQTFKNTKRSTLWLFGQSDESSQ